MPSYPASRPFLIKEKIGDMMKYGKMIVRNFPRRERRTADEIQQSMLSMYKYAIMIEKKVYKKTTLQELDVELAYLKHLVRMAHDSDYFSTGKNPVAPPISDKQYETWSRMLDEIGNMIGGYINYINAKDDKSNKT